MDGTVAVPERDSLFSLVVRARPDHIVPQTALFRSSHHFSKRADTLTERVDEPPDRESIGSTVGSLCGIPHRGQTLTCGLPTIRELRVLSQGLLFLYVEASVKVNGNRLKYRAILRDSD